MKLKLQKHGIIFKLSQTEKIELSQAGHSLVETLIFPGNNSLTYILSLTANEHAALSYLNNEVILQIPQHQFALLLTPSKKGITFAFEPLHVSVQVDLLAREKHALR